MTIERWQAEPWMDQTAIIRGMGEHIDRLESELTAVQTRLAETMSLLERCAPLLYADNAPVALCEAVTRLIGADSTPATSPAPEPALPRSLGYFRPSKTYHDEARKQAELSRRGHAPARDAEPTLLEPEHHIPDGENDPGWPDGTPEHVKATGLIDRIEEVLRETEASPLRRIGPERALSRISDLLRSARGAR